MSYRLRSPDFAPHISFQSTCLLLFLLVSPFSVCKNDLYIIKGSGQYSLYPIILSNPDRSEQPSWQYSSPQFHSSHMWIILRYHTHLKFNTYHLYHIRNSSFHSLDASTSYRPISFTSAPLLSLVSFPSLTATPCSAHSGSLCQRIHT